jgi:hypothetical protein
MLRKNSFWSGFVTGHDFSRADKANKMNGALAPAAAHSSNSLEFGSFSAACSGPRRQRLNVSGLQRLRKNSISASVLKGHGFSRAVSAAE